MLAQVGDVDLDHGFLLSVQKFCTVYLWKRLVSCVFFGFAGFLRWFTGPAWKRES